MMTKCKLSYEELIRIVDELYDEVLIYDNNYKIEYINKACERHYGMTQDEMIGKSFFDFADDHWVLSVLPHVYKTKEQLSKIKKQ